MHLDFTLQLPRDAVSVPVVRRVVASTLDTLGVVEQCATDVEIALSEACTNVLDHAIDGRDYSVVARVANTQCTIDVIDHGPGFVADRVGRADAEDEAEGGRGIQLIRALVDQVRFERRADDAHVVTFTKRLAFAAGSPGRTMSGAEAAADTVIDGLDQAVLGERDGLLEHRGGDPLAG